MRVVPVATLHRYAGRRPLQVLDDEVRVDQVEAAVRERERPAQIGGQELVNLRIRAPAGLVEVDPDQPVDPVAVRAEAGPAAAARLEHARARAERLQKQVGLDVGVRGVKRRGPLRRVDSGAILESRG